MIAYIEGKIAHKDPTYFILDVQGVGYQIRISLNTFSALKEAKGACKLFTHLHIKEDAHTLYGFAETAEKNLFLHLVSVTGIGPNTALMILSSLTPEEIYQAIVSGDYRTLQSVKGIGTKTAQRAILELKDKMKKENLFADFLAPDTAVEHNTVREEALAALMTLGIPKPTAEKNVSQILKTRGSALSVEEVIKLVLKSA
ncbi:holliday junction DNA helicase RuvA [Catalinimonas alkaloidigena]|uniref:Holliday junction branch migration complex subunit RuvA n=1 Tax=Catalinimonas alkaloidigena TaxID=1075417 RepID=A0A1G9QK60_9BACT|nr:Holliday junction branch migration protein RuvA [Catalinimonas alkaloidigena]SDM11413.1 holliday junction DNA helicase RuvA [Catalinimonas alkaloidigena]